MELAQFNSLRKILHHDEWLSAYRRGESVAPICVEMDMTNVCNYGCPNCVWGEYIGSNRASLERDQALDHIRKCAGVGVKAIIFSGGGEPLLHRAIDDCILLARELGLHVGLFTNGIPITRRRAAIIARVCVWVRVHLDAVSPDGYLRRHGLAPDNVGRVHRNLIALREENDALTTGIGCVFNYDNVNELEGLAEFARNSGCQFFQAKHDFALLEDSAYTEWWAQVVVPRLQRLEDRHRGLAIQYTCRDYTARPTAKRCHIHHLVSAINADSEYVYCKRLRDRSDWSPGNLLVQSLRDILDSKRRLALNEQITPHNCGINCPYIELNEFLEELVAQEVRIAVEAAASAGPHSDFF